MKCSFIPIRCVVESIMDTKNDSITQGIKCSYSDDLSEAMTKVKTIEELFDDDEVIYSNPA